MLFTSELVNHNNNVLQEASLLVLARTHLLMALRKKNGLGNYCRPQHPMFVIQDATSILPIVPSVVFINHFFPTPYPHEIELCVNCLLSFSFNAISGPTLIVVGDVLIATVIPYIVAALS